MRYKKCCVPGCNNKRGAMILHKFPICSKRRRIWLDSINCPSLRALSMVELCKQCVCHKHFEGRFVTLKSRLLIQAYPTLITEKEISSGVPTHPNSEVPNPSHRVDPSTHLRYFQTQLVDHNYFASSSKDPEPSTLEYVLLIGHNLTPAPVAELEFQDTENLSPKRLPKRRKSYKEYKKREAGLTPSLGLVKQFREKTMLEVCVDSLESAINAIHGGADELEVCSSLTEAGLTPSPGLVKQIREMVDNISKRKPIRKSCNKCACESLTKVPKINVMIRCRTGSDFHYSKEEMDTMLYDIDVFKDSGIDRFVFGALTDTQDIDELNCTKIMHRAHPIPVTFHRAFDVCKDPKKAIEKIIELGFDRLLTSGQKPAANEEGAIELLTSLIKSHGDNIQIMPGAGVTLGNVNTFIDIGCNIVHSSCKFIRYLPQIKDSLSMGITDGEYIYVTVEDTVRKMKNILSGEAIVS